MNFVIYYSLMEKQKKPGLFKHKEIKGMFDGPIVPLLFRLAMPILAGMVLQLAYNITDTYWIGKIDKSDPSFIGGTGMIFPIFFFTMALANGIQIGVSSLVARAIGEKNEKILGKTTESGLAIAIFFGILFLSLGYIYDEKIISLLGASKDYMTHALEYFRIILYFIPLIFISSVFHGMLQGEGRMKYIMHAMLLSTLLNIALDPVFIFTLKLKVQGAALATVISHSIGIVYVLSVFLRKKTSIHVKWKLKNIDWHTIGKISSIGFTQAASMIIMSVSFMLINRIVISIDKLAMTAYSIAGRIDQVAFMPIIAFSSAVLTMVGQNAARGKFERARKIWNKGMLASGSIVLFMATIMVIFARTIYSEFSNMDIVINYAVTQTRIVVYTYIFAAIGIMGRSVFLAIGHPMPSLIMAILRMLILNVPSILILVYVFDLKMYGVWFGMIVGNLTSAVISYLWVRSWFVKLKTGEMKVIKT